MITSTCKHTLEFELGHTVILRLAATGGEVIGIFIYRGNKTNLYLYVNAKKGSSIEAFRDRNKCEPRVSIQVP